MEERGHLVTGIRPTCDDQGRLDDPPDVLAEMDGELIGVEVTDLLEHIGERRARQTRFFSRSGDATTLTWRMREDQVEFLRWDGPLAEDERRRAEQRIREAPRTYGEAWATWNLPRFQERLGEIVEKKDRKMGRKKKQRLAEQGRHALEHRLSQSVLLIFTPEIHLQARLDEYLKETVLARPKNFDRVFLMGTQARQGGARFHPVHDLRLS